MNKRKDVVKEQTPEGSKPASVIEADKKVVQTEEERDLALEQKVIDVVGAHTESPLSEHKEAGVPQATKHSCGECKFYDHATEREFHRDGIRKGLVETRAICRATKDISKASGHLVKRESDRPCYVEGVYVKEEEAKIPETKPAETPKTKKKTSKKHSGTERAVTTNHLASSGDTKVLQTKNGTSKVVVKNVGEE